MPPRAVTEFARSMENNFETSKYWEFERILGLGSFGVTVLLKEREHAVEHRKRIALKLAQVGGIKQLENEIKWLRRLHGAKHIVKMLASCDDLVAAAREHGRGDRLTAFIDSTLWIFGKLRRVPPITAFDTLAGVKGPALALEYLEHGDLLRFKEELDRLNAHPPNRILWSLFLCLIRACTGMAYPVGRPLETASILETMPSDGREWKYMIHGDIAPRNIMLGYADGLNEHFTSPALKMIDFGAATQFPTPGIALESNIHGVASIIANLIDHGPMRRETVDWENHTTLAGAILPSPHGHDPYPSVDLELRGLVARCMYTGPSKRPSLEEVLAITSNAVLTKTAVSFPDPTQETNGAIRAFWQRLIFDAPPSSPAWFDNSSVSMMSLDE
ncbi:kinase-like protein [Ustulina deusta]|nr:kinase-like protein [Ustulina deusta]